MFNIKISNLIKTSIIVFLFTHFSVLFAQDSFGGLALYTVREDMGKDSKATLQAVAEAGYINIEAAGYENGKFYDYTPQEFKAL